MTPDNGLIDVAGAADDRKHEECKDLLRFLTCGSVDDGKSTLVGRLLFDSELVFEDELVRAKELASRSPTGAGEIDLALLVDGLLAEREQGITIDVAYRFFATEKRNFIVADTPGHEQYTRNMATGASSADLAVLLVDARKGLLTQTRRHSYIVSLLGIHHVVLTVNKMDLVDWDQATFEQIAADYRTIAGGLGIPHVTCIPLSALAGDNVLRRSEAMPWYDGPTLMQHLESVQVASDVIDKPFRLPVQWVNRPNQDFRGYAGTVVSGSVKPGDRVVIMPSGRTTSVSRVVTMAGELPCAMAGEAVTLILAEEIDVGRGDVIAAADAPTQVSDQFAAHVVWMGEQPLLPGRPYLLQLATNTVGGQVTKIKHKVDVNSQVKVAATHLELNEVGICNVSLDRRTPFDAYADNRDLGGFILIDRLTNATVGCGMIDFALRRGEDLHWQALKLDKLARAQLNHQKPCVLWFTGLSGAGKSTVADVVEQELYRLGHHTTIVDGDNLRHGLSKDLGFTDEDRVENIRRAAEVAKLMVGAGLIVLVSLISPFRSERRLARGYMEDDEFLEIFVDAPLDVCEARDPKGLYRKARAGQIPNFTGIGSPYEPPENPELRLLAGQQPPEALAVQVISLLRQRGVI